MFVWAFFRSDIMNKQTRATQQWTLAIFAQIQHSNKVYQAQYNQRIAEYRGILWAQWDPTS